MLNLLLCPSVSSLVLWYLSPFSLPCRHSPGHLRSLPLYRLHHKLMMHQSLKLAILVWALSTDAFALPSWFSPDQSQVQEDQWYQIFSPNGAVPSIPATYADPPRLPGPPAAAVSEGGGWLSRWLSMGGEGDMDIIVRVQVNPYRRIMLDVQLSKSHNITLPHRPAAFPSQLIPPMTLPLSGILLPFSSMYNSTNTTNSDSSPSEIQGVHRHKSPTLPMAFKPELGCVPPSFPTRYEEPPRPWKIALVERGECDFASKVRAAQERGAAGVVVGDGKLRDDETEEEGRQRESLITMFSPGEFQSTIN